MNPGEVKVGQDVKYQGSGRPRLLGLKGTVKNFNEHSVFVEFTNDKGQFISSDWVGMGAVKVVGSSNFDSAINTLNDHLETVIKERQEAQAKFTELRSKEEKLLAAIAALRSLENV